MLLLEIIRWVCNVSLHYIQLMSRLGAEKKIPRKMFGNIDDVDKTSNTGYLKPRIQKERIFEELYFFFVPSCYARSWNEERKYLIIFMECRCNLICGYIFFYPVFVSFFIYLFLHGGAILFGCCFGTAKVFRINQIFNYEISRAVW